MLICPQCKFENSNSNKFCQNCGASLTHKVCPECSASVPVEAQTCDQCGAECGTVWWAIITQEVAGEALVDQEEISIPSTLLQLSAGSYLDQEQRYQLLAEPILNPEEKTITKEVGVKVLDCQPYQISPLEAMLANQQQGLVTPSTQASKIPSLAQPYIDLKVQKHPGIPPIHDAWQQGDTQLVLIQDRSNWQLLIDLWKRETTTSLQILHWCYQMTQLWALLEPVNCRQSLLDLSNLRVDEDQTLALSRLYTEPFNNQSTVASTEQEQSLTVKTLGRVWQQLFKDSQRTQFGFVVKMLGDLEQGKIETIAQLRSRLEDIATELEAPKTAASFVPETDIPTAAPTTLQLDDLEEFNIKNDDLPTVVLPMQLSSLEEAGRTDVGRQRHHNEDNFGIETKLNKLELPRNRVLQARGLYILCDGMGGHAGGEIASELAVNTLRQYFKEHWVNNQLPTEDSIREAVYLANQAIYDLNQQDARSGVGRMGTTLVMLLVQDTHAAVAHVGDSRLYRLTRKHGLEQVTVDHEVGQREIARGVETSIAYARPDAYQLTQALGPRDQNAINPDVDFFEINEDSLFILVSDGLSDNDLLETHWQNHLLSLLSSGTNLDGGVTDLIDLANQYNGHDNITAILIRAKVRPNLESQR
ncbi:MAG: serine/threonine phosphatase [Goleter apudmare HA4340-LM2]|jgi:protein phosphatase|nr:serine/threonine phosphatase [Goleter apudmare HA4340-LM2]